MVSLSRLCKEFKKIEIELIDYITEDDLKIEYITILELPEKNYNFKRNGLVLSTFQAFKDIDSINEQITWLKKLGVLGIGFHQAHYKEVPKEVIQHCKQLNMPLYSIPINVPYHKILDIFNQLESEQLNLKSYEIYKMNEKILESVFLEKDVGYIINLIGNYTKENIIFLDSYMKIRSVWKDPVFKQSDMDKLTSEITSIHKEELLKTRFYKRETLLPITNVGDEDIIINIIPIVSKKNFLGYLIINKTARENFYNDEVIRMGIRAISMSSSKQNSGNNHLRLRDIKKFEILINNESHNLKESDFYISISKLSYCMRIIFEEKEVLEEAFNSVNTVVMEKNSNVLTWNYNGTLIVYLENDEEINELIEILEIYTYQAIGLSAKHTEPSLDEISKMNQQARTAMLSSINDGTQFSKWDQIGIEKVVYNIDELSLFKYLDEEILLPLIEYDRKKDGNLIDTLKSVLSHFFNTKAVAEEMFIHPNTVRYRISQINDLLDIEINRSSNYALLVLALKIYEKNK